MSREIILSNGGVTIVDDDCFEWLSQWRWFRSGKAPNAYAGRTLSKGVNQWTVGYMHRVIAGAMGDEVVDHANGDPLDNRRANLRVCTRTQNAQNCRRPKTPSGFRGVYFHHGRWRGDVTANRKVYRTKSFDSAADAALARDYLARLHHREFAILNFPEVG